MATSENNGGKQDKNYIYILMYCIFLGMLAQFRAQQNSAEWGGGKPTDEWVRTLTRFLKDAFLTKFEVFYTEELHDRLLQDRSIASGLFYNLAAIIAYENDIISDYDDYVERMTDDSLQYNIFKSGIRHRVIETNLKSVPKRNKKDFNFFLLDLLDIIKPPLRDDFELIVNMSNSSEKDAVAMAFHHFKAVDLLLCLEKMTSDDNIIYALNTYANSIWLPSATTERNVYLLYIRTNQYSENAHKKFIAYAIAQLLSQLGVVTGIFPRHYDLGEGTLQSMNPSGRYGSGDLVMDLRYLPPFFDVGPRHPT